MSFGVLRLALSDSSAQRCRMAKKSNRRPQPPATPQSRFGSIHPGMPPHQSLEASYALPPDFVASVTELEKALKMPVWLLVQDGAQRGAEPYAMISDKVTAAFFEARHGALRKGERIAVL